MDLRTDGGETHLRENRGRKELGYAINLLSSYGDWSPSYRNSVSIRNNTKTAKFIVWSADVLDASEGITSKLSTHGFTY